MTNELFDNPFYRQYQFKDADYLRKPLPWRDKLLVLHRPMYCKIHGQYLIKFKTLADGRIFIFGFEKALSATTSIEEADEKWETYTCKKE